MAKFRADVADAASPALNDLFSRVWALYEAGRLIPACAWCDRVRIGADWLVPPSAALAAIDTRNVLSHSICGDCAQAIAVRTADPRQQPDRRNHPQGGTR